MHGNGTAMAWAENSSSGVNGWLLLMIFVLQPKPENGEPTQKWCTPPAGENENPSEIIKGRVNPWASLSHFFRPSKPYICGFLAPAGLNKFPIDRHSQFSLQKFERPEVSSTAPSSQPQLAQLKSKDGCKVLHGSEGRKQGGRLLENVSQ